MRYVSLTFVSTSSSTGGPYSHFLELDARWEALLRQELADAPQPVCRGFALAYQAISNPKVGVRALTSVFAVSATYPRLFTTLATNLAIAVGLSYVVLALLSASPLLAAFATATVAAIIGALLGLLQLCDWTLGTNEMCGGAVVVEFAFEYSLHLACAYRDAPFASREERVVFAAAHMGPTLIRGALTTLGSLLFMFATGSTFLLALARMVTATAFLSVAYALLFFLPLCAPDAATRHAHQSALAQLPG